MNHLKADNGNYFKHMLQAWRAIFLMIIAIFSCIIHSIFPFMFQKTTKKILNNIINNANKRHGVIK
jgi:ABC-type Na+ efflux pump permease subunit